MALLWVSPLPVTPLLAFALFLQLSSALTPDGKALLELKEGLNDTRRMLKSWRARDPNPCGWTGVTCHFPDLRVRSINLPYMQLSGIISPSIGKLGRLHRLALHQNSLHGLIPPEIRNCTELRALYLRANFLQGSIPPELGELKLLSILDLSSNLLGGVIPPSIGKLSQLHFLNLSTNFFSGEIPSVLGKFRNSSFVGNLELCGLPVQKLCRGTLGFPAVLPHLGSLPSSESSPVLAPINQGRSSHFLKGMILGSMSTMGLALILLLGLLWMCLLSRKGKLGQRYVKMDKEVIQDVGTKLVTFHGELPYSTEEIIKRLELLDEEDLVGSGGFGTVYKMVMDDFHAFAVKRLDRSLEGLDEVFERELPTLGSIKHINLVNLRGYCRLHRTKFLIYDYMTLGSLDHYLHEQGEEEQDLNWNARMKIALGSARGLAYLHHDCSPTMVHRDFKSSNILLDSSLEPHISDFGLAKLLVVDDAHVTTVVAGTFGYLAPEYLHTGRATEKSDVYSFGVLLLELVTGKRPTDPSFVRKGLNIVGWMNMLKDGKLEDILDVKCGNVEVEAVEIILEIAVMCTDANPEERPAMSRVLQMLEEEIMSPCFTHFYEPHFGHLSNF